ncbi:MAG TPA: ribokinase [Bryobacteraceae bacterium]|nr:ribokinase [Bryobacteraceae bacterium]
MRASILVAGSLNMDFVARVAALPAPGQTVPGLSFDLIPGGKGANQACAAGKLAGPRTLVRMAGCVGADSFGEDLCHSLALASVEVDAVRRISGVATGAAMINVDAAGQNTIVVVPGANHCFEPAHVEALRERLRESAWVLLQLESPLPTVEAILLTARQEGARSMLDPAPARSLTRELLLLVDVLTPNESEACSFLGRPPSRVGLTEAPEIARALLALGPRAIVLKLGEAGCYYSGPEGEHAEEAFAVSAVDATAAGDTFNAALAVAFTEGLPVPAAIRFANAAAALSVTRAGAQTSAPSREATDAFLAQRIR